MKNLLFCLCILCMFSGCTDATDESAKEENTDFSIIPPSGSNEAIDKKLFEEINLDYPGLEKAKAYFEANEYYRATEAILKYFRNRTQVTNPNLSLINVTITANEQSMADYALTDGRFYVKNYYEDANSQKPYAVKKNNRIDWSFSPAGADDEYQKQLHRHQWFIPQAKAYRVSGDEKYIKSWIEVYKDWIAQNPMPESGTNTTSWWQLQVATRVTDQTQLFEYYKNSVNFTPEWLSIFLATFAQQTDFLKAHPYKEGNILITQASALAAAGTLFPEFKKAGEWQNEGFEIFSKQISKQFLADGMHYELDFSYHISAIADYYEAIKLAQANGIADKLPSNVNEILGKAADIVMHFSYPNYFTGTGKYFVPGFNDTRQDSWSRNVLNKNFKRYVEMFPQNKEFAYMAGYGKQGSCPNINLKIFPTAGYYMLRNGWTEASTMLILSNNYAATAPSVWTHNQPDNGTFELYHNGRNFFPDSGVFAYTNTTGGGNADRNWFRQSQVHNTLTMDEKNFTTTQGKYLPSVSTGTQPAEIIVTENKGYAQMKQRRAVFFVDKKFFVLIDEAVDLTKEKSLTGTVNLNFNLCEGSNTEVVVDAAEMGAHSAFTDGNNILIRTFGNKATRVKTSQGKVSYKPGQYNNRTRYAINMEKETGTTACRFITVIYPVRNQADAVVSAKFPDGEEEYNENRISATVIVDGNTYNLKGNISNF